jgi:hypothetical protein
MRCAYVFSRVPVRRHVLTSMIRKWDITRNWNYLRVCERLQLGENVDHFNLTTYQRIQLRLN